MLLIISGSPLWFLSSLFNLLLLRRSIQMREMRSHPVVTDDQPPAHRSLCGTRHQSGTICWPMFVSLPSSASTASRETHSSPATPTQPSCTTTRARSSTTRWEGFLIFKCNIMLVTLSIQLFTVTEALIHEVINTELDIKRKTGVQQGIIYFSVVVFSAQIRQRSNNPINQSVLCHSHLVKQSLTPPHTHEATEVRMLLRKWIRENPYGPDIKRIRIFRVLHSHTQARSPGFTSSHIAENFCSNTATLIFWSILSLSSAMLTSAL